jgi:glutamine synthetase type III
MSLEPTAGQHRVSILKNISEKKPNVKNKTSTASPYSAGGETRPISEYFGELTFGLREMREKLNRDAYNNLLRTLDKGERVTKETAEFLKEQPIFVIGSNR